MKTLINKRTIGNKNYLNNNLRVRIIEIPEYRTNGENFILVKNTISSKIILDPTTTDLICIKTLTNVIIKPFMGKIDEEYDEILMNNGSCVEFFNLNGEWYILSSDGLKLE